MDDLFEQLESGRKRKLAEHHIAGNVLTTIFKKFLFITPTYFICSALCLTFVLECNESKGAKKFHETRIVPDSTSQGCFKSVHTFSQNNKIK